MENLEKLKKEAIEILESSRGSHDWEHTERVLNMCMHIASVEGGDTDIIQASALLHDIGRHAQDLSKGKLSHAEIGVKMARPILERYQFSPESIERILHCIETHRYRKGGEPRSLEAHILFDADKLDAIGAIGIGRAFVFAGENGAAVHIRNLDIENSKSYTKNDTAYREFKVKLEKVRDRIFTDEGKRLAEERHDFMVEFFNRLKLEAAGEI
ncbi:MAG: HD domain-containing protein [Clostridiales bacterium]|nr:HD domain-containing protein [Clostridiales bacterium]